MVADPRLPRPPLRPDAVPALLAGGGVACVVLVEGWSDEAALRVLALRQGRDLDDEGIAILPVGGITNLPAFLDVLADRGLVVRGLCDSGERHLAPATFAVCDADLEDELLRALGEDAATAVIEAEGDLAALRSMQAQPDQRGRPPLATIRRWLGAGAGRKIRYAGRLVQALPPDRVPAPLREVLAPLAPGQALPRSPLDGLRVVDLAVGDGVERLQRFFDANPLYFEIVSGTAAPAGEAQEEIHGGLPPGITASRRRVWGYATADGTLAAMAHVVVDLMAPRVWHLALFIVETARHGTGDARRLVDGIEAWARAGGARWMRLGVVVGNERGERFWRACGYRELRTRDGVPAGPRMNTVRVLLKPLGAEPWETSRDGYLALVPRDRAE